MRAPETNDAAATLALRSLVWALGDPARAERLLALTGLAPADLRDRAADPALQAAVLGFLEAHEPDLIACAEAIGTTPERLVTAHRMLAQ